MRFLILFEESFFYKFLNNCPKNFLKIQEYPHFPQNLFLADILSKKHFKNVSNIWKHAVGQEKTSVPIFGERFFPKNFVKKSCSRNI